MMDAEWRTCPSCPPEEGEWPASDFTADPAGRQCNACWAEIKKVRRPCSTKGCTRKVLTTGAVEEPRCRPCRRRIRGLLDFTRKRLAKVAQEGKAIPKRRPCTGCGATVESTNKCPAPLCLRCRNGQQTIPRAA